jgi:hypothetical protein
MPHYEFLIFRITFKLYVFIIPDLYYSDQPMRETHIILEIVSENIGRVRVSSSHHRRGKNLKNNFKKIASYNNFQLKAFIVLYTYRDDL